MRTHDAWFPRYALGNGLMFFCRVFSPAVGRGSSALSTFLDRRTQRVNLTSYTGKVANRLKNQIKQQSGLKSQNAIFSNINDKFLIQYAT